MFPNWRADILHRKAAPILPPKHFVSHSMAHSVLLEGGLDRTLLLGIGSPIQPRVVCDQMHGLANELRNRPSDHPRRSRIHKRGLALKVQPKDPFTRHVQD